MADELEARIRRLEDIEAIKKMKATYMYLADDGDWQGVVDLFAEEAVADFGPFGHYEGKSELAKFYQDYFSSLSLLVPMIHNPIIEVKGDRGTGKWYLEEPCTDASTNRALWLAVKYEDEYVKIDGEWKFKTLIAKFYFRTPYDEGWVKTRMYEA